MGGDFVIDNSVVMAWCFEDEGNDASYLNLAIRKGLPIASQDKAILRAAKSIQLDIFQQHLFPT